MLSSLGEPTQFGALLFSLLLAQQACEQTVELPVILRCQDTHVTAFYTFLWQYTNKKWIWINSKCYDYIVPLWSKLITKEVSKHIFLFCSSCFCCWWTNTIQMSRHQHAKMMTKFGSGVHTGLALKSGGTIFIKSTWKNELLTNKFQL